MTSVSKWKKEREEKVKMGKMIQVEIDDALKTLKYNHPFADDEEIQMMLIGWLSSAFKIDFNGTQDQTLFGVTEEEYNDD